MTSKEDTHSKTIGYILWIFGFMGAHRFYYGKPISGTIYYILWIFGCMGAHRFYYGKPISGTIYFFTLVLLFVGWIVDLFLIPGMDARADFRFAAGPLNYNVAWALLTFLGILGVHRFYMGKWLSGILYFFTGGLGLFGIIYDYWTLNDQLTLINTRAARG